jgi:WS/DGAT C-terminal domain
VTVIRPRWARQGSEGGMFIARLPVGVPDEAEQLKIIMQATATGKSRPDQGVAGIVALPASLAWLGVAWAKRAAATHINLYVTNVPGPTSTLYLGGARLMEAVPLAPLVAGVRLSVTALSYDGQSAVSLLADDSMPDLPVLAAGAHGAFEGYVNAVARSTRIDPAATGKSPSSSCGAMMSTHRADVDRMFELAKRRAQAPLREPLCGDIPQLRHVPGSRHGCPDRVDFETATLDNDPLPVGLDTHIIDTGNLRDFGLNGVEAVIAYRPRHGEPSSGPPPEC